MVGEIDHGLVNTLEYDTVPKLIDRLNDVADELGFDAPLDTVPLKKARKGQSWQMNTNLYGLHTKHPIGESYKH